MRIVLVFAAVLSLSVPVLHGAIAYTAKTDTVERQFNTVFGDTSRRTWNNDVLLTLVGRTSPIVGATESAGAVRDALWKYLGVTSEEHLRLNESWSRFSSESVHYEFNQVVSNQVVENARISIDVNKKNQIIGIFNQLSPGISMMTTAPALSADAAKCFAASAFLRIPANCDVVPPQFPARAPTLEISVVKILFAVPPLARWAYAVELHSELDEASRRYVIDGKGGFVLEMRDHVHFADPHGRIFNPTPLTDPAVRSFRDVKLQKPPYEDVPKIPRLNAAVGGRLHLSGDFVNVVDFKTHQDYPNDDITSADGNFAFERGSPGFASVMVYVHVDAQQKHVQDLGLTNVASRPIRADVRTGPMSFKSKYINTATGTGDLVFGYRETQGQVFQAEDGDVIAHEYGHALQSALALMRFDLGDAQTLAMSEGFADYWAMSYFEKAKLDARLLPTCIGAWMHGSTGVTGCTREVKLSATMKDFNPNGNDHHNATVWTAVLWAIRTQLGRPIADKLILKSHETGPDGPSFLDGANAIFTADDALYEGRHHETLCTIFADRGLMRKEACPPPQPN